MHAETYEAKVPQINALNPNLAKSLRRVGASSPIPPICIAIEPKFAKPQSAKLAIITLFGDKVDAIIRLLFSQDTSYVKSCIGNI